LKNRSKEQIIVAFLEAIDSVGTRGITAVLREANYEYDKGRTYIKNLVKERLVEQKRSSRRNKKTRWQFSLTQKGRDLLNSIREQNDLIDYTKQEEA